MPTSVVSKIVFLRVAFHLPFLGEGLGVREALGTFTLLPLSSSLASIVLLTTNSPKTPPCAAKLPSPTPNLPTKPFSRFLAMFVLANCSSFRQIISVRFGHQPAPKIPPTLIRSILTNSSARLPSTLSRRKLWMLSKIMAQRQQRSKPIWIWRIKQFLIWH